LLGLQLDIHGRLGREIGTKFVNLLPRLPVDAALVDVMSGRGK
jgi:hypothetical protein